MPGCCPLPGEIPDIDAVFGSGDFPRVRKDLNLPAPPLFSFNSNEDYADIPFPDYSYWGHEMRILNDDQVCNKRRAGCAQQGCHGARPAVVWSVPLAHSRAA